MSDTMREIGRRQFVRGMGVAAVAGLSRPANTTAAEPAQPGWPGVIVHAGEGLPIPPSPDGRTVTIKFDSQTMPSLRMSMIAEDLPPQSEIAVHLHQREDEIILIRSGSGIATLGDREAAVGPGASIYVPQNTWHGLRNNGTEVLSMTAIYSPPGFEQAFKDRMARPNRTQAETDAHRKKHGIVYRHAQGSGKGGPSKVSTR